MRAVLLPRNGFHGEDIVRVSIHNFTRTRKSTYESLSVDGRPQQLEFSLAEQVGSGKLPIAIGESRKIRESVWLGIVWKIDYRREAVQSVLFPGEF